MSELDIWAAIRGLKQQLDRLTSFEWPLYAIDTWTPTWTGLTVVGAPSYAGRYTRIGRIIMFLVEITAGGANTTASTLFTTFVNNLPLIPLKTTECFSYDQTTGSMGQGVVTFGRVYTPTWVATNANFSISGWYEI